MAEELTKSMSSIQSLLQVFLVSSIFAANMCAADMLNYPKNAFCHLTSS